MSAQGAEVEFRKQSRLTGRVAILNFVLEISRSNHKPYIFDSGIFLFISVFYYSVYFDSLHYFNRNVKGSDKNSTFCSSTRKLKQI
jgi:hypothetical protein